MPGLVFGLKYQICNATLQKNKVKKSNEQIKIIKDVGNTHKIAHLDIRIMDSSDEENFANIDGWKVYDYVMTKTAIIGGQMMDFFPALLDSPPWIISLFVVMIVAPLIMCIIKLVQWIRQSTDHVRAVKVCV